MYKVCIDPAHGGIDKSNIGYLGCTEADCVLDISNKLFNLLDNDEYFEVVQTRKTDETVTIEKRCLIANMNQANLLISIHTGILPGVKTICYKYNSQSELAANYIHEELAKSLKLNDNGVSECNENIEYYELLKLAEMPTVLINIADNNNIFEEKLLSCEEFKLLVANSIYNGIRKYFEID